MSSRSKAFASFKAALTPHGRRQQINGTPSALSYTSAIDGSFLNLPNELIEVVAAELRPVDLTCLSLTCKRLYFLLLCQARASSNFEDQKRRLLLRLEDELPDWLLCHWCVKLFKWRSQQEPQTTLYFRPGHRSCPHRLEGGHDPTFPLCGDHKAAYFHRETRDLILRYYQKGPQYGLPLSYIEHSCHGIYPAADERSIKMTFNPKIVDGHFMIWRTDELRVNLRDRYIREDIYKFHDRTCCHIGPYLPAVVLCQIESIIWQLDFDYDSTYTPSPSHRCTKPIHCPSCNTDIRVDLEPRSDRTAMIRVNTWYSFGRRNQYLMSGDKDALKAIKPRPYVYGNGTSGRYLGYYVRDLEQLYNGGCTRPLQNPSGCRRVPNLHTYQDAEKWKWTHQGSGYMKIELPEGPHRNQLHFFPSLGNDRSQSIRLPWIRRPGCPFARLDMSFPLLRQVFSARVEIRRRWESRVGKVNRAESFHRYEVRICYHEEPLSR